MNNQSASVQVIKLEKSVDFYALFCKERVTRIEQDIEGRIQDFQARVKVRVGGIEILIIPYVYNIYLEAEHHYVRFWFHASPGFAEWSCSFMPKILSIFHWIGIQILTFVFPPTTIIMGVVQSLYPDYEKAMAEISHKVSEFSAAIGFGADGLSHLIQATQGSIGILKGVLGKDDDWMQFKFGDSALKTTEWIAGRAGELQTDPSGALGEIFFHSTIKTAGDVERWWIGTSTWIGKASDNALKAVKGVSDVVSNLQKLENSLPDFIRDNIPQAIWDGINWTDNQIDNIILPGLGSINKIISEINAQMEVQRARAKELAEKLALPGDLLAGVDELSDEVKALQEQKIDDITSRLYERQADEITAGDSAVISELERIRLLSLVTVPPPVFSNVETSGRPGIIYTPAEKITGWFVGDF